MPSVLDRQLRDQLAPRRGEARLLGRPGRAEEVLLESPNRVEVIARPDHPYRRRGGLAVLAGEVVADRLHQPPVRDLVMRQRLAYRLVVEQARGQVVVPA